MGAWDPPRKKTPIGDWPFTYPLTDLQNRDNPAPFLSPKQPLKLTNCREWVQSRAHKIWWKDKKPNICPQRLVFFNSSPFPSALGFIKMVSVHLARALRLFLQNPLGCLPLLGIWNKTKKKSACLRVPPYGVSSFLSSRNDSCLFARWKRRFRPASRSNYRSKKIMRDRCVIRDAALSSLSVAPCVTRCVIWISPSRPGLCQSDPRGARFPHTKGSLFIVIVVG